MTNQILLKKWIDALRSGDYIQDFGKLKCNNKFCAFGVLFNILDPDGWDGNFWNGNHKIMDEVGLPMHEMYSILEKNDDQKLSFEEIADYLERKYGS